jgi:carbonic anhydrase
MFKIDSIRKDFLASLVVFLVAIPLCLGIALATNVPLSVGILTGAIGGIIVGFLSDSRVSVSGPAAGMVALVIAAINQLGSYETFLLALIFAGGLQFLGGILRSGFIANYVPATVVKGLLAAIGILIIIKELPMAFGYFATDDMMQIALRETQETLSLKPLLELVQYFHFGATFISLVSLFILFMWHKVTVRFFKVIPAAFVVVVVAILMNFGYQCFLPAFSLESAHLVNIPVNEDLLTLFSQFKHPDFSALTNFSVYWYALMIAMVASLETLLNLEAIEKIDKRHRYCSRDKELIAQGVGNMISGFVGGLPITSVIARSSVNINAGAKTKLSTILHGIFLFFSLSLFAKWLNYIPISALASVLIYTGYKLASVKLLKEVYEEGAYYFAPFIITILAIVFTNLLLGIVIGLIVSIFFILKNHSKNGFTVVNEKYPSGDIFRLVLPQQATFLNRAAMIERMNRFPRNSKVIVDAQLSDYIDEDILEIVKDFKQSLGVEKNILINLEGFKNHYNVDRNLSFINATTYDVQSSLTPQMILKILQEGNQRFINNTPIHKNYRQQITVTAQSQHPIAVVLSCIDSRVPVEVIFDLSLGDLFVVRIAGNIANDDVIGSIEFACHEAGAKLILVLGHKSCGAVKAACDHVQLGHVTQLLDKIKPAIELELEKQYQPVDMQSDTFVTNVARTNVQLTKKWLYDHSSILNTLISEQKVLLVGGFYDVHTGIVELDDHEI